MAPRGAVRASRGQAAPSRCRATRACWSLAARGKATAPACSPASASRTAARWGVVCTHTSLASLQMNEANNSMRASQSLSACRRPVVMQHAHPLPGIATHHQAAGSGAACRLHDARHRARHAISPFPHPARVCSSSLTTRPVAAPPSACGWAPYTWRAACAPAATAATSGAASASPSSRHQVGCMRMRCRRQRRRRRGREGDPKVGVLAANYFFFFLMPAG